MMCTFQKMGIYNLYNYIFFPVPQVCILDARVDRLPDMLATGTLVPNT